MPSLFGLQVAVELFHLATEQALLELRGALLNDKPASLTHPDQLPWQGAFSVRAIATGYSYDDDAPLSEAEFNSRVCPIMCALGLNSTSH
eukprot:1157689-Pelagomonas_calceolata.AAC.12